MLQTEPTDLISRDTKVGTFKVVISVLFLSPKSIPSTDHLPPLSLPPSALVIARSLEGVAVVVLGLDLVAVLLFTRGTTIVTISTSFGLGWQEWLCKT